jgi:hypothetical protein
MTKAHKKLLWIIGAVLAVLPLLSLASAWYDAHAAAEFTKTKQRMEQDALDKQHEESDRQSISTIEGDWARGQISAADRDRLIRQVKVYRANEKNLRQGREDREAGRISEGEWHRIVREARDREIDTER